MSRSSITYLSRPEPERRRPPPAPTRYVRSAPRSVARSLGWFSLALGAAQWLRPHHAARAAGVPGWAPVVKAWGLREMLVGAGVLLTLRPAAWMWARVAGDVLDLATLGLGREPAQHRRHRAAFAAVLGLAAVDVWCARALSVEQRRREQPWYDYSDRSGFPRGLQAARSAAAWVPDDLRRRPALQPQAQPGAQARA
ncbi:MAG: hypothetical protein AB1666_02940 [Pseudomonadota bacterium]|uniref:Cyclase dehydrase n=2 Tax=Pseudomonadota TaxID=1224 RepID=A0ABY6MTQ7_9BURK|nr:hypothetical protein [Schlegelella aquatica]UZD55397.1 hypothetical protein OMP39_02055 [Schlegelella aquatica]